MTPERYYHIAEVARMVGKPENRKLIRADHGEGNPSHRHQPWPSCQ